MNIIQKKTKKTLRKRQITVFLLIIVVIMGISMSLHMQTTRTVREMTYEKMESKAMYYQELLNNEISHVLNRQIELLYDRGILAISSPKFKLEPYEKREMLLSLREKLSDLTSPAIVESAVLYIPQSEYKILPGAVRKMTEADREELKKYADFSDVYLNYDGENFFSMKNLALNGSDKNNSYCRLIVTFSSDELRKQLNNLTMSPDSGAAYYNENLQVILENDPASHRTALILDKLERDENGFYQKISGVNLDGKKYLVLAAESGKLGMLIQYAEETPIMEYIQASWRKMIFFMMIMLLMAGLFIWYDNKLIHKPLEVLLHAMERVQEGNLDQKIHHKKDDEFAYLYQGFNNMEDRVRQLLSEVAQQTDLAQKAQLKQLQAQINPHFLYNSFFILSRRIKRQDFENAEKFAKHLGNYFKYLARDASDYIPLVQETEHAKSYAAIQGIRFSNRIEISFAELPEKYRDILVPRLIIQPLLENAFKYSLENKVSGGILSVDFSETKDYLWICVGDNGDDISDELILKMQRSLEEEDQAEVTGIINIHRRLKLYYKDQSGLQVTRSSLGGVAVNICIPCKGKEHKENV